MLEAIDEEAIRVIYVNVIKNIYSVYISDDCIALKHLKGYVWVYHKEEWSCYIENENQDWICK